jgi:histidinol dehydrogenase
MSSASSSFLRQIGPHEVKSQCVDPVDPLAREQAQKILADVKSMGMAGLLATAQRLGDLPSPTSSQEQQQVFYSKDDLKRAFDALDDNNTREVLTRTAERIRSFAAAQRASLSDLTACVPGGQVGHSVAPIAVAGCYAPGGRYPLPSSVLMTAVTARAAGVQTVFVASPRPAPATLAAAHVAGADGLLAVGGAQAIAALAYGVGPISTPCDVIVGPGNKWVTAAKSLVAGICAIDMLAGTSCCLSEVAFLIVSVFI